MLLIHSVFAAESVVVWLSPVPFRSLGHPLRFRGHLRRDASSCDLGRLAAWRGGPRGAARGSTDPELQGRFCGDSRGWRSDDLGTCFLDLLDVWSFLKVFFSEMPEKTRWTADSLRGARILGCRNCQAVTLRFRGTPWRRQQQCAASTVRSATNPSIEPCVCRSKGWWANCDVGKSSWRWWQQLRSLGLVEQRFWFSVIIYI